MNKDERICWVFLDFAGTLAFNDPPRAWHYLRACARRDIFLNRRDVWAAIREVWAAVDRPAGFEHPEASKDPAAYDLFREGLEEQILERLGVVQERGEIIRELLAIQDDPQAYALYPEAETSLARLHGAGYQLCIVSNFTWALPDLVRALGLSPYIQNVITSARTGYRKPHPKIFEAALTTMCASPAQSLFIGDNYEADVVGPSSYGFRCLLVDRQRTGRYPCSSIALLTEVESFLSRSPDP